MKISVCMAIYNGEKYIEKQLKSIKEQTHAADEVILCDDGSTDDTRKLIRGFIQEYQLSASWKLYENSETKGYPGNFYYAMSLCSGDLVFLADQDDLWNKDKLEKMMQVMNKYPYIGLLASKWGIMDGEDHILRQISRGKVQQSGQIQAVTLPEVLKCFDWPGMCMCYRREIGRHVLESSTDSKLAHDMALALTAAEEKAFYCVSDILQYHRRHAGNLAMEEHRASKLLNKERKIIEIDMYLANMQAVLACNCLEREESIGLVQKKLQIMQERKHNLTKGSRARIVKQYFQNREEIRIATLVCDLLICRKRIDKK